MKNHTYSRFSPALMTLILAAACTEPSADTDSSTPAVAVRTHDGVAGPVVLADQARSVAATGCDPLAQDCPTGELCHPGIPTLYDFSCITDNFPAAGEAFAPCSYYDACAPGFYCINSVLSPECDPQEIGCCLPWCDTEAPDCPDEHTCEPWFSPEEAAHAGYENVGLCINFQP